MNYYEIYIKSHTDAPDYEDHCEAESIDEAVDIFEHRTGDYIYRKDIIERTLEGETSEVVLDYTG